MAIRHDGVLSYNETPRMYRDLLPDLCCPHCRERLTLEQPDIDHMGEIVGGCLRCERCEAGYPVRHGIADFLGPPRPPTPAQVVNEWPLTAWAYERLWRPFALTLFTGERFLYGRELALLVALVEPRRGGLYVDLACSNGLYARALAGASRGASGHVVGVDHALPMLAEARRRARQARLPISYVRARAQALPLKLGGAAGVAIGGSLNEIGDLEGCLAEVWRVLAPDGRYVAMTLTAAASLPGRALQALAGQGGIRFWTPDQLVQLFARHGLRTTGCWTYGIVMFSCSLPQEIRD